MGSWQRILKYLSLVTYLGMLITVSIGLGFYGGQYLDKVFNTDQVFTIIGILVGATSGIYMLYKTAIKFSDE